MRRGFLFDIKNCGIYYYRVNIVLRERLNTRLTNIRTRIEAIETGMSEMSSGIISTFELDTGEADQKVIFTNVTTLQKFLSSLYAQEELIMRRLSGNGIVSVKVRRKP